MTFQLTATFSTAVELARAAALLAGMAGNAAVSTVALAASSPTAAPTAAPTPTPESTLPVIKDFKTELVPLLQAFAKKDKAGFEGLMKKHGFAKVTDIEAKPDTWGALAQACK